MAPAGRLAGTRMVTLDQGGWIRDDAHLEAPPDTLHDLVEHTFVLDVRHARQPSWMILPDYSAHILVHLAGRSDSPRVGSCSIVGPRTVPIEVDVADRLWTIGARLRPGALPALTGLPASDMVDVGAGAGAVWGSEGDGLDGRLSAEPDPRALLRHVVEFLAERARRVPERDWRARGLSRQVLESGGTIRVEDIAERMGSSIRALRASSRNLIGVAPKRFARTHRLFRAIDAACRSSAPDWARIATASGYADQPHLVRDFGSLLGESPTRFHARGVRAADSFKTPTGRGTTLGRR